MKENKGITLIALVVTIIVLLILAGVAIAMLRGDNGILNRASEAKYSNAVASFEEQVKLAQMSLKASITSNMVGKQGYIATAADEDDNSPKAFTNLVNEVRNDLGITKDSKDFNTEGFTVTSTIDDDVDSRQDVIGNLTTAGKRYIYITYTDNSLRSSLPTSGENSVLATGNTWRCNGIDFLKKDISAGKVNQAVLVYCIEVTNYGCNLAKQPVLTTMDSTDGINADKGLQLDTDKLDGYLTGTPKFTFPEPASN